MALRQLRGSQEGSAARRQAAINQSLPHEYGDCWSEGCSLRHDLVYSHPNINALFKRLVCIIKLPLQTSLADVPGPVNKILHVVRTIFPIFAWVRFPSVNLFRLPGLVIVVQNAYYRNSRPILPHVGETDGDDRMNDSIPVAYSLTYALDAGLKLSF
jgi:hypothetical protein